MFKWKNNLDEWIQLAELDEDGKIKSENMPDMDYIPTSAKGAANGVATLGSDGKVPSEQLPSQLPSVTSADNDKFLCVVNGAWNKKTVPSAENGTF